MDDALSTKYVALGSTCHRVTSNLQAQLTGGEGEKRLAGKAGSLGAPSGFEEAAFVRGKEGERGVALAYLNMSQTADKHCY